MFTNSFSELLKKNLAKSKAHKRIIEMLKRFPNGMVASTTFRNKSVNVRIPFKISTESMKNKDETRSKRFRLIFFIEYAEDHIANRMKEAVKKGAIC